MRFECPAQVWFGWIFVSKPFISWDGGESFYPWPGASVLNWSTVGYDGDLSSPRNLEHAGQGWRVGVGVLVEQMVREWEAGGKRMARLVPSLYCML